ncbi:hypothetical protein Salat_1130400 [Sesamum alatum]|uniref:Uncharacterized protein n=1 Tax=Sesamum alatum TaxID=300844 RepID=A0AAE1YEU2_9LAMI|nr:hypothetical protein Salat_1130400 [Sesamum alatum]
MGPASTLARPTYVWRSPSGAGNAGSVRWSVHIFGDFRLKELRHGDQVWQTVGVTGFGLGHNLDRAGLSHMAHSMQPRPSTSPVAASKPAPLSDGLRGGLSAIQTSEGLMARHEVQEEVGLFSVDGTKLEGFCSIQLSLSPTGENSSHEVPVVDSRTALVDVPLSHSLFLRLIDGGIDGRGFWGCGDRFRGRGW